jgi:hypothetical protein
LTFPGIDKEELHKVAQIVSDAGKYGYPSWEELHGIMGKGGKGVGGRDSNTGKDNGKGFEKTSGSVEKQGAKKEENPNEENKEVGVDEPKKKDQEKAMSVLETQNEKQTPKTPLTESEKAAIAQDELEKNLRLSDAFGRFWKRKKCPYVQLEFEQLKEEGKLLPGDVVDTRYTERSDKHLDLLYRRWMEKEGEVSI